MNEYLETVSIDVLMRLLTLEQQTGEAYSETAAAVSLYLDLKHERVKSVRAYSRIWKWSHKRARSHFDRLLAQAEAWFTWHGKRTAHEGTTRAQRGHNEGTKKEPKSNICVPEGHNEGTTRAQRGHTTNKTRHKHRHNTTPEREVLPTAGDAPKPNAPTQKKTRFVRPDQKTVCTFMALYAEKRGLLVDAPSESERFMNHYTSNGWRVGRNAMKDWQATAMNWISRARQMNGAASGASKGGTGPQEGPITRQGKQLTRAIELLRQSRN